MRHKIFLVISVLALVALVAEFAKGQTRVAPEQIREWSQVSPPKVQVSATRLQLRQLAIDRPFVGHETITVVRETYDHHKPADQPNLLLFCLRPETDPLGPGCVAGVYWLTR